VSRIGYNEHSHRSEYKEQREVVIGLPSVHKPVYSDQSARHEYLRSSVRGRKVQQLTKTLTMTIEIITIALIGPTFGSLSRIAATVSCPDIEKIKISGHVLQGGHRRSCFPQRILCR
jgi:hypothetical protein